MSKELVEIDGSLKEGGGQILRIATTLSVLTRTPIRVRNIRSGRSKPGLMEQHLKGLELVNSICNGKLKGGHISSTEIEFWPGKLSGGSFRAAIKTAGSISLLLQVALPCLLYSNAKTTLTLEGGTNAEMAPQIDYTTEVFRPYLEKFGGTFDFDLIKRGYFPKGGGKVVVNVNPVEQLNAIELLDRGTITSIYGWSFVAGTLPLHLAHAMTNAAVSKLKNVFSNVQIETYKEEQKIAPDNGSGIILVAQTSTDCILGASALGKRKEKPEETGIKAAEMLLKSLEQNACVDEHIQDQLIVFMALAKGCSKIKMGRMTLHTETAIYITEQLAKVKFEMEYDNDCCILSCNGIGLKIQ